MRKRFPKDLLIGSNIWKIKFVKKIPGETANTLGLCCQDIHTIYIKTRMNFVTTVDVFVHEVLHALEFEHRFKLKHRQVYMLARHIAQLYIDNF